MIWKPQIPAYAYRKCRYPGSNMAPGSMELTQLTNIYSFQYVNNEYVASNVDFI